MLVSLKKTNWVSKSDSVEHFVRESGAIAWPLRKVPFNVDEFELLSFQVGTNKKSQTIEHQVYITHMVFCPITSAVHSSWLYSTNSIELSHLQVTKIFCLFWVFIKMPIVMLCSVGFSAPPYIFTNDSELRWKWIYKIMYTNLFHVHVLSQPSCNWLNWSCNKIRIWIQTL